MKLLTVNYPKGEEDLQKIQAFDEFYAFDIRDKVEADAAKFPDLPSFEVKGVKRANLCVQFVNLLKRAAIGMKRDALASRARMGQNVFMALLVIAIYNGLRDHGNTV